MTQAEQALRVANSKRYEIRDIRKDLRRRQYEALAEVLSDPPEAIHHYPLAQVLAWTPYIGPYRVEMFGEIALIDGVNLLTRTGFADDATKAWLVNEATLHTPYAERITQRHAQVVAEAALRAASARRIEPTEKPYRSGRVPVGALRDHLVRLEQAGRVSLSDVAARLGWFDPDGHGDRQRIRRALGIDRVNDNGAPGYARKTMHPHVASAICRAAHIDPRDVDL